MGGVYSLFDEGLAMDPLIVASNVSGLQMENDRVRVMRAILKPGD
jgi:quercetin dioxygenase-like cupin family protein